MMRGLRERFILECEHGADVALLAESFRGVCQLLLHLHDGEVYHKIMYTKLATMNGVLGHDPALVRLYWAGDNLGICDEFCYESFPCETCDRKWNEWCMKVPILHCKAIMGRGQTGLMRCSLVWIMPQVQDWSLDQYTCSKACYHWTITDPTCDRNNTTEPFCFPNRVVENMVRVLWKPIDSIDQYC